jgi:uncharacterized glyoxalase superfamily protein PhnB
MSEQPGAGNGVPSVASATTVATPDVIPVVRYADARAAITFLTEAFGFTATHVYDGEDGGVAHAELTWEGGMVMLGTKGQGSVLPAETGPSVVYVVVDDPDAHHERAVAAGADVLQELTDQDYGSREYTARDPEGNIWSFGTYRPAPVAG